MLWQKDIRPGTFRSTQKNIIMEDRKHGGRPWRIELRRIYATEDGTDVMAVAVLRRLGIAIVRPIAGRGVRLARAGRLFKSASAPRPALLSRAGMRRYGRLWIAFSGSCLAVFDPESSCTDVYAREGCRAPLIHREPDHDIGILQELMSWYELPSKLMQHLSPMPMAFSDVLLSSDFDIKMLRKSGAELSGESARAC